MRINIEFIVIDSNIDKKSFNSWLSMIIENSQNHIKWDSNEFLQLLHIEKKPYTFIIGSKEID